MMKLLLPLILQLLVHIFQRLFILLFKDHLLSLLIVKFHFLIVKIHLSTIMMQLYMLLHKILDIISYQHMNLSYVFSMKISLLILILFHFHRYLFLSIFLQHFIFVKFLDSIFHNLDFNKRNNYSPISTFYQKIFICIRLYRNKSEKL